MKKKFLEPYGPQMTI